MIDSKSDSEEGGLPTCMHFMRQREILVNLLVMSVVWTTTTFNYYMVQYILNKFKDEYRASLMSALSDITGLTIGGLL